MYEWTPWIWLNARFETFVDKGKIFKRKRNFDLWRRRDLSVCSFHPNAQGRNEDWYLKSSKWLHLVCPWPISSQDWSAHVQEVTQRSDWKLLALFFYQEMSPMLLFFSHCWPFIMVHCEQAPFSSPKVLYELQFQLRANQFMPLVWSNFHTVQLGANIDFHCTVEVVPTHSFDTWLPHVHTKYLSKKVPEWRSSCSAKLQLRLAYNTCSVWGDY